MCSGVVFVAVSSFVTFLTFDYLKTKYGSMLSRGDSCCDHFGTLSPLLVKQPSSLSSSSRTSRSGAELLRERSKTVLSVNVHARAISIQEGEVSSGALGSGSVPIRGRRVCGVANYSIGSTRRVLLSHLFSNEVTAEWLEEKGVHFLARVLVMVAALPYGGAVLCVMVLALSNTWFYEPLYTSSADTVMLLHKLLRWSSHWSG